MVWTVFDEIACNSIIGNDLVIEDQGVGTLARIWLFCKVADPSWVAHSTPNWSTT